MKDKSRLVKLNVLFEEMLNVCALYSSHRMQVYLAAMEIIHRLNVDPRAFRNYDSAPIEEVIKRAEKVFTEYPQDSIYVHLKLIFLVFKFEYYFKHEVVDKAEILLEQIKPHIAQLLVHYENFGFPAQILNDMLLVSLRNNVFYELPEAIEDDNMSEPSLVLLYLYRAVFSFYHRDYQHASRLLFELSNRVSFKDYPELFAEVKCLITLVYYKQHDAVLFAQNYSSAQRLLRRLDKQAVPGLAAMIKFLGVLGGKRDSDKGKQLTNQLKIIEKSNQRQFALGRLLLPILKEITEPMNQA
jgi:hypothetical protein